MLDMLRLVEEQKNWNPFHLVAKCAAHNSIRESKLEFEFRLFVCNRVRFIERRTIVEVQRTVRLDCNLQGNLQAVTYSLTHSAMDCVTINVGFRWIGW